MNAESFLCAPVKRAQAAALTDEDDSIEASRSSPSGGLRLLQYNGMQGGPQGVARIHTCTDRIVPYRCTDGVTDAARRRRQSQQTRSRSRYTSGVDCEAAGVRVCAGGCVDGAEGDASEVVRRGVILL